MAACPFGVNAFEFPHWPIEKICELGVSLGAQFIELSGKRMTNEGLDRVARQLRDRGLTVHVNCQVSELPVAFAAAKALGAPFIIVYDDAVERADMSRRASLDAFRKTMLELLEQPGHAGIRIAMENQIIKITRDPEDLLAIVQAVGHPRFGVNYDPDNYYNAGLEGFPYAYELVKGHIFHMHAKDSARYLSRVHGDQKRVLHRAGGNVICVPLGTGAVNWTGLAARLQRDGYAGPISLEPHNLPEEMAPGMELDAAFLRRVGLVK
ncbi:MAG TPA: sugar phosphate isomerase/epimerase family protein [Candidatus Sulfotelmatobacter sp.]|nr:sugar phosphate isomerase/epimerase family protein [Candidatus Sulfotelmatobacter sp.]